jgi:hypothetical protein
MRAWMTMVGNELCIRGVSARVRGGVREWENGEVAETRCDNIIAKTIHP